jgi:phage-related protein
VPRRRKHSRPAPKRRWRDYRTASGRSPVVEFIKGLASPDDRAEIYAAMGDVRRNGLAVTDHLEDEIYEAKAEGERQSFRILFAPEGEHDQVLLALAAFSKKTQKTPRREIELAKRRLRDWRVRGRRRA